MLSLIGLELILISIKYYDDLVLVIIKNIYSKVIILCIIITQTFNI